MCLVFLPVFYTLLFSSPVRMQMAPAGFFSWCHVTNLRSWCFSSKSCEVTQLTRSNKFSMATACAFENMSAFSIGLCERKHEPGVRDLTRCM